MKNVTITLEDDVALWIRVKAAMHNTSVSKLVGEELKTRMSKERGYKQAQQRYLTAASKPLKSATDSYPERASLHNR